MIKQLKLSALALLITAAAVTVNAGTTNLLQSVSIALDVYSQGTPSLTQNFINESAFNTKGLIKAISASGTFNKGDVLVRVTPVTNVVVYETNLVAVSTTNLVITNISTSEEIVSNDVIFGGTTNYIGNTNVTFGTNIEVVDGTNVTIVTNTATIGTNVSNPLIIGTNTTVTVTTLTNAVGNPTGTSYDFVINALNVVQTGTNKLGTASWAIFNTKTTPSLTPISTNVIFDIYTDHVYAETNLAYIHGEKIKADGKIEFGKTEEIRTLVLSNSIALIKLQGYAHGSIVPVSLGRTASAPVVYSQNYNWTGNGSGNTNGGTVVLDGSITETALGIHD